MFDPGDVVVVDFPGVTGVKRRPDVIVGLITSQVFSATGPTDYTFQDWAAAGLRKPSAFRSFLYTTPRSEVLVQVGRLTPLDWQGVQASIKQALGPF